MHLMIEFLFTVIYPDKLDIGSQNEGILLSRKFCLCASIISEAASCGVSPFIILGNLSLTNKIKLFIRITITLIF